MNKATVISLGGSLIVPDDIDTEFINSFRNLITGEIGKGNRFAIITGGGKLCREYQAAARSLGVASEESLDWVGIYATRLNAALLQAAFGPNSHGEIIVDPKDMPQAKSPVIMGAGGIPGHSSDFDAVLIAEKIGAKKLVNLSNIDFVYDKDPRKFPGARKIERASWREFRSVLPAEWTPGINVPFDPVAAKKAEELGLELAIMNGKPLQNLKNYLEGKAFRGTVIN